MPFPVELEHIKRAEIALGVSFPASFVERMRRLNGGEITIGEEAWSLHPFADATDRRRITRTASHVLRETQSARGWRGFPADGVSIASNGMGDHLLFLPDSEHPDVLLGVVYMWSHETAELDRVGADFAELMA